MLEIPKNFDWIFYLNYYPELRTMGVNDEKKAQLHYIQHGHTERRFYCDDVMYDDDIITYDEPIMIVYFVHINPHKKWKLILSGQIHDMISCRVLEQAQLFIVMTGLEHDVYDAKEYLNELLLLCKEKVHYTCVFENHFEYEGLKKLHQLGTQFPDKIFLYMHTKGMVFHNRNARSVIEKYLTFHTLKDWKNILYLFETQQNINKIGLFPSTEGWVWYNFFWVRGDYLKTLDRPMIKEDRYSYEYWISDGSGDGDCYSLLKKSASSFTQNECIHVSSGLLEEERMRDKKMDIQFMKRKATFVNRFSSSFCSMR